MVLPKESWPRALEQSYQRIKPLGKGAFGTVWLATKKSDGTEQRHECRDEVVAIKAIGSYDKKTQAYASREISILRELSHPNIIKLFDSYQDDEDSLKKTPCTYLVLSFARGPTLGALIEQGGAIGLPLTHLLSRQLISAVSYLHSRAVLHRDIKPDNCIVASQSCQKQTPREDSDDDDDAVAYWGNGKPAEERIGQNGYQLVLIDFGFARALSPFDLEVGQDGERDLDQVQAVQDVAKKNDGVDCKPDEENEKKSNGADEEIDSMTRSTSCVSSLLDDKLHDVGRTSTKSLQQAEHREDSFRDDDKTSERSAVSTSSRSVLFRRLNSTSKMIKESLKFRSKRKKEDFRQSVLGLSSLGTRAYAAPEVIQNRRASDCDVGLTDRVADYGFSADAYSVGMTLREMLTGIPPDENEKVYIANHREGSLPKHFGSCCCGSGGRRHQFRRLDQPKSVPPEAAELVQHLTASTVAERLTVVEAQNNAWILGGGPSSSTTAVPFFSIDMMDFLECTKPTAAAANENKR